MIALDLGQSAIYLCVLGLLLMFLKNKIAYLGRVLMALGLIFLAMDSMAVALAHYKHPHILLICLVI